MRIAIAQPTYLPWLGYFDLMEQVECFVLLDDVQFDKRSWQQRNRIKGPSGLQWLTVPVASRGRFEQRILDVEISEPQFWRTHLRALEHNYHRAPYFELLFPQLARIFEGGHYGLLVELNFSVMDWLCGLLGIQTKRLRSSAMAGNGKRSERLVNICRHLGADTYLSPLGSSAYLLEELQLFSEAGIQVLFQHYEHPQYKQLFSPFCSHASVLDLLFNEGDRSAEIMRSGRRTPFTTDELMVAAKCEGIQ